MQYDRTILFRVSTQERLLFKLAAQSANLRLSEFIRGACRREAELQSSDRTAEAPALAKRTA